MAESLSELARRVDQLERAVITLADSARRRDVQAATASLRERQDQRVTEVVISAMIG